MAIGHSKRVLPPEVGRFALYAYFDVKLQRPRLSVLIPERVVLHHELRSVLGFHDNVTPHLDAIARGIDVGTFANDRIGAKSDANLETP